MRWAVFLALLLLAECLYAGLVPRPTRKRYEAAVWTSEIAVIGCLYHAIWLTALAQSLLTPRPLVWTLLLLGAIAFAAGQALLIWAMRSNPWFLRQIVWAPDQQLVTTGAYRYFRHPGYIGFAFSSIGIVFLLGQPWAWLPCIAYCAALLRRAVIESRFLKQVTAAPLS